MATFCDVAFEMFNTASFFMNKSVEAAPKITEAAIIQSKNVQNYWAGILKYVDSFIAPSFNALGAFLSTERGKLPLHTVEENVRDYGDLFNMNVELANRSLAAGTKAMGDFWLKRLGEGIGAAVDAMLGDGGKMACGLACADERLLRVTVEEYPKAIQEIGSEYGFHFEREGYVKAAETERFDLYRVLPSRNEVVTNNDGKPILIIPPYVLGANILAFLPGEHRSYVHCFADQGIPTYIRVIKDIDTVPAVQVMTGEDDALDIAYFCRQIMSRHEGKKVSLNGFCQGGYHSLAALLSGELDGMVDALITCATPVDGSRSKSLKEYMMGLPPRFRDISYSVKTLPNGNRVVDGRILGWVYKLRKIAGESPIPTFHRDLNMFEAQRGPKIYINKTAAAINHWITYDQKDLPLEITRMSFTSYLKPIDEEGNLPVTLFGRKLNFKRLEEMGIPWLICIADNDDLVDSEASLVALKYIDAEVCVFPKGHAALATSWSVPTSECALHLRFRPPGAETDCMSRGPVCFHLDLQQQCAAPESCEAVRELVVEILAADDDKAPPAGKTAGAKKRGKKKD